MDPVPAPTPVPDVDQVAAALRADVADLEVYSRVLGVSLAEGLPQGMVTVDRDRSMADRIAGRPGAVAALRIAIGDWQLELHRSRGGVPEARVAQRVRGVAISSKTVGIDEWVAVLAQRLSDYAQQSTAARAALARLLGQAG